MLGATGGFVAGSIFSKLVLDKTGWNNSIRDVEKDQKRMGGMSEETARKFQNMGRVMTVAGAAIVGAVGLMVRNYVKAGDEVHKMALRTGFATETLSELRYAAQISGADIKVLEKGVKRMSASLVDANNGLLESKRAFDELGLSTEELIKLSPEEQFLKIGYAIAEMENPTLRAATAQDIFGRAGTQLLPLFAAGAEGLDALRQKAHELGIVFDEEAAAKAARLQDAQTTLKEALSGLTITIAEHVVPVITRLVEGITGIIQKFKDWAKEHPGLAGALTKIVTIGGGLMTVLGPMLIILPKLAAGFGIMKAAIVAMTGPLGIVITGVGALTVALLKQKAAQDAANESSRRAAEAEDNLFQKLKRAADQAGLTEKEFLKLRDAYHGNAAAMAMAIKQGKEGKELQEALADVSRKHREEIEKQIGALINFSDSNEALNKTLKTTVEIAETEVGPGLVALGNQVDLCIGKVITFDEVWKNVQTTLHRLPETALPAARDMTAILNQVPEDLKTQFLPKIKTIVTDTKSLWEQMADGLQTKWATTFSNMLSGARSFKDGLKGIWDAMKEQFFDILGNMVSKWITGFLDQLLTSSKQASAGIVNALTGGAGGGAGGVVGGISGAAAGIWTGVGAAIGTFLGSMLAGGISKQTGQDQLHTMRLILQALLNITEHELTWILWQASDINKRLGEFCGDRIPIKIDMTNKWLKKIRDFAEIIASKLGKITPAQGGAVFKGTELALMHGTPTRPEVAIPMPDLADLSLGRSVNYTNRYEFALTVKDQLDPYSAQRIAREQLIPQMLNAIEINDRQSRSRLENILRLRG